MLTLSSLMLLGLILGCAGWVFGLILVSRLEAVVGWRRLAWYALDRCQVCGYSLAGLPPTQPCPECGTSTAAPPPLRRPTKWWISLVALALAGAPIAWIAAGMARHHMLTACLHVTPTLLLYAGVLAVLWPCGPRMRWSLAMCVMGAMLLVAAGVGWKARGTGPAGLSPVSVFLTLGFAVFALPVLLCAGILVGAMFNRALSPTRPWLS